MVVEPTEATLAAFLAAAGMDAVAEYVERGGVLKGADTAALIETYTRT